MNQSSFTAGIINKIKMKAYEESFYLRNDSVPSNDHNG